MTTWIIEPRDPLIVRDGRPFGPDPGARAKSLPFPFPSTTTGGVRTRAGVKNGVFEESKSNIAAVKNIKVRGPLLVELTESNNIKDWLAPAPTDAILFPVENNQDQVNCQRLVPLKTPVGSRTNLEDSLALVGLTEPTDQKPSPDAPRFWRWDHFEQWLTNPRIQQQLAAKDLGHQGPQTEQRMHVRLEPNSGTAMESFLFLTSGLEFVHLPSQTATLAVTRLGLAVETEATISDGIAPLGGERRLMTWRRADTPWPQAPPLLKEEIASTGACRLVLLTPGYFTAGYHPGWLGQLYQGVTPTLGAVALARPQVVSGWDFEKSKPKPTRRLAPPGTVYFLKLTGNQNDIEQWVEDWWMKCVSDDDEFASAGFGLAALGTWTGQLEPMKEAS
jgi:CRISPR-associated protein Cmr3